MVDSAHRPLPADLTAWLDEQADRLDTGSDLAADVVPRLAAAGLFGTGVPEHLGGNGGDVRAAILAIAAVARHSLTAAFVFWGHRTFIEYLLHSPNAGLRARWLPALLRGEQGGATGLSNAMKFLSGIESLQIAATSAGTPGGATGWRLDGGLAWITNLRKDGFVAAAAVAMPDGAPPAIVAFTDRAAGVARSADLDLLALRGSNTAAIKLEGVYVDAGDLIHHDARQFLPPVRPGFLGMQCGMSIGLAQASLAAVERLEKLERLDEAPGAGQRGILAGQAAALQAELQECVEQLLEGVHDGRFRTAAAPLFRLRIALAGIVREAVMLELQASGGRAYLQDDGRQFARHWRESAFVPIVTPSLTQLQAELHKQAASA